MATSIKGTLQAFLSGETGIFTGKVIATNPLSVRLQDDPNMRIGEALMIIPEHLQKHTATMTIDGVQKTVEIDDSLKINDVVLVLSVGRGARYILIGRC